MTNATMTAAITAALLSMSAQAFAAAGTTPLGDCYNHVISVCNEGNHPVSCSNAGMNACDKEHSANISLPELNILRATAEQSVAMKFKAATGMEITPRAKLSR